MNEEFIGALEEIEREKGISKEIIFDALESALISSYKKNFGTSQNVTVDIDRETGKIELFAVKEIVADEDVEDDSVQMTITDAKKLDPNVTNNNSGLYTLTTGYAD